MRPSRTVDKSVPAGVMSVGLAEYSMQWSHGVDTQDGEKNRGMPLMENLVEGGIDLWGCCLCRPTG